MNHKRTVYLLVCTCEKCDGAKLKDFVNQNVLIHYIDENGNIVPYKFNDFLTNK